MKLSLGCFLLLIVSFVASDNVLAQSTQANTARPTSEQSLQELVREVRQLRATLQRINTAMYKGQVMLERLKLQQDQVFRISRELADTRENLTDIRSQQTRLKEMLTRTEAGVEGGTKHPGDVASIKGELEFLKEREQRFAGRETQLMNDLEAERAKLNELNDRLNALELELAPIKQ
jgi:DNA repair exonuclease SbcCD ATPase subunit